MIIRFLLSGAVLLASAAYAQQGDAPGTPRERPPLANDLKIAPKEAPPGKLCLIQSPERCGDTAQLIRKPYTGGGSLYYLERPAKPDKQPPAPSLKPPHN